MRNRVYRILFPLIGLFVLRFKAFAQQEVFAPLPPPPITTLQPIGTREFPDPSLDYPLPPASPFQFGSFTLKPHFLYRFLYGDGIQAIPGHESTTAVSSIAPGLFLSAGTHWALDYTPTWDLYSNHIFHNTVDEAAMLSGSYAASDWSVQFTQSYLYSSLPLIETGRQTTEETYTTGLDISFRLSRQILSETIFNQSLRYAITFPDSKQWSVLEWLHYQFGSQLDAAVGGNVGYIDMSQGLNIFFSAAGPIDLVAIK